MNLRLISRKESTQDTSKYYYDAKKKQLVTKRVRTTGELNVSALTLSNIQQWDGMMLKQADEIKELEENHTSSFICLSLGLYPFHAVYM